MQETPPEWLRQLDELVAFLSAEQDAAHETELVDRLSAFDPELLSFLVAQFGEQDSPQAATLLELIAAHPDVSEELHAESRARLDSLATRGIATPAPGVERFYAGWVQRGRERGEQILLLGWRVPDGDLEALVFLLDWRGDGLKDFYRTRRMNEAEWRELVAHNAGKGAPLVEVTLSDARALLEAALAESQRFSRPIPRDYKLESALIQRRILDNELPASPRTYVAPDLSPEDVVSAYIAALHFRDYRLAALLLDPEHTLRADRTLTETAEELRLQLKHTPRRAAEAEVTRVSEDDDMSPADVNEVPRVTVQAEGTAVQVERNGRRVKHAVRERYVLRQSAESWLILSQM